MLEFEHIIQVNDLSNPEMVVLTRQQLWEGLVLRARRPDKFNDSLQCRFEDVAENEFLRIVTAGHDRFYERVLLYPQDKIHTRTLEGRDQISAESYTHIQEPEEGSLFVRFCYRRDLDDSDAQANVAEHLKSAYVFVDKQAIGMIRMLAESELSNSSIS